MKWMAAISIIAGIFFRLYRFQSYPGLTADEGWWGLQTVAAADGGRPEPRTLSGNPANPFLFYPMAWVHLVADPSPVAVRLVPLLSNLAMIPVFWWLSRRVFGPPTAAAFTAGVALFPVAIHCGRLAYDPSQSVLASGVAILLALHTLTAKRWLVAGVVALSAFAASLLVHPTNIFAAPVFVVVAIELLFRHRETLVRHPGRTARWVLVGTVAGSVLFLLAVNYARGNTFLDKPWLSVAGSHLSRVMDWVDLAVNYLRLLSGGFVYVGVTDHAMDFTFYDLGAALALVTLVLGVRLLARAGLAPVDRALFVSWPLSLLVFHALAGPHALKLHYGLALVVPVLLVASRTLVHGLAGSRRVRRAAVGLSAGAAALLVASFHANYFVAIDRTGGLGHRTYRTSPTGDPKAMALATIAGRGPSGPKIILSYDLWLAYPLRYLGSRRPELSFPEYQPSPGDPALREALEQGTLFIVEYAGWPGLEALRQWASREALPHAEWTVRGPGGVDQVTVISRDDLSHLLVGTYRP